MTAWRGVGRRPGSEPDLLAWLERVGDEDVRRVVAQRRAESAVPARATLLGTTAPQTQVPTQPVTLASSPEPSGVVKPNDFAMAEPALDMADMTVLAQRSKRILAELSWADSPPISITKPVVIIGRRLWGREEDDSEQTVEVPDPTTTISAVHARLEFKDGQWLISDLDSTNGIFATHPGGSEQQISAPSPVPSAFYLGDVLFLFKEVTHFEWEED